MTCLLMEGKAPNWSSQIVFGMLICREIIGTLDSMLLFDNKQDEGDERRVADCVK